MLAVSHLLMYSLKWRTKPLLVNSVEVVYPSVIPLLFAKERLEKGRSQQDLV